MNLYIIILRYTCLERQSPTINNQTFISFSPLNHAEYFAEKKKSSNREARSWRGSHLGPRLIIAVGPVIDLFDSDGLWLYRVGV
jgi:hypothetical protein